MNSNLAKPPTRIARKAAEMQPLSVTESGALNLQNGPIEVVGDPAERTFRAGDATLDLTAAFAADNLPTISLLSTGEGQPAQALLEKAIAEFERGDLSPALLSFADLLAEDDLRPAALYGVAVVCLAKKAFAAAHTIAQFLTAAQMQHPGPIAIAGKACFALGKGEEARLHLAHAARAARKSLEHRQILQYVQRTLLDEQFGVRS